MRVRLAGTDLFCASPAVANANQPDDDDDELIPRTEDERWGEILEKIPAGDLTSAMKAKLQVYREAKAVKASLEKAGTAVKAVDVSKAVRIIKGIALLLLKNSSYKAKELDNDAGRFVPVWDAKFHRMDEAAFIKLVNDLFPKPKGVPAAATSTPDDKAKKAAAYLFFAERQCAAVEKPMRECGKPDAFLSNYQTGSSEAGVNLECARVGKSKTCTSKRNLELYHGESKIADLTGLLAKLNRDEKAAQALKLKRTAMAYKTSAAHSLSGGSQLRDLLARA